MTRRAPKPVQHLARFTAAFLIIVMPVIVAVCITNMAGL